MAVGIASAVAASILGVYKNTTWTGLTAVYVKLHTADPGAAGAGTGSANTTRNAVVFGTISAGSMPLSTLSAWTMTTTETISHISLWDASTAGNFLQSAALTTAVPVINGSTLTVSTLTLSYTPLAA